MGIRAGALAGGAIAIAAESTFCSYNAADLTQIDVSGLGPWYTISTATADLGGLSSGPKMRVAEHKRATARGGRPAVEVISVVDSLGVQMEQVAGEFRLTVPGHWLGATLPTASAMDILLGSCLQRVIRAAGASASVLTTPTDNTFTVGAGEIGEFKAGDIIAVDLAGVRRFHRVTNVNTGTNTVTTATEHGIAGTGTVRHCHLYLPPVAGAPSGGTFALIAQDRAGTFEVLLVGCRVMGIGPRRVGDDGSVLEWELRCAASDGYQTIGSTSGTVALAEPLPWGVAGTYQGKILNAPVVISDNHAGGAAPYAGSQDDLETRTWSADITVTMDRRGGGQGKRNGVSDWDVTDTTCTVTTTLDISATLNPRAWLKDREVRSLTLTLGGYLAAGSCGALHIPYAGQGADPGVGWTDERKALDCSFREEAYAGDSGSAADPQTNAKFVLAFMA